jgi:hypothetical protein
MSDLHLLKLVALAPKSDEPFIPPLQQVVIFISNLGYICGLEPQLVPNEAFELSHCSSGDSEQSDGGIGIGGIDALGRYDSGKVVVILDFGRIAKLCATHGFHREDVVKVVLIHELAHFVTHLGTNSGACWEGFCDEESEKKEDAAQESTHLLLRVAGYGHLVQVFDALSQLCPSKYNTWRNTWDGQLKSKETLDSILRKFPASILDLRPKPTIREDSPEMVDY